MRRVIVLSLCVAVLFSGCSNAFWRQWSPQALSDRVGSKFQFVAAEKKLQALRQIPLSERKLEAYEDVVSAFEQLISKYPKSYHSQQGYFRIAALHIEVKNYEEARKTLQGLIKAFPFALSRTAEASYQIAITYLREGKWGEAERAYWYTANHFPFNLPGLQSPIQILLHYIQLQYFDATQRVYEEVVEHYVRIQQQVKGTPEEALVRNYLAMAHAVAEKWDEARDEFLAIANDFPEVEGAGLMVISAAEAMEGKGNDALADAIYRNFLIRYPEHEYVGFIHVRVGDIAIKQNRLQKARGHYQDALAYFQNDNYQSAEIQKSVAETYLKQGDFSGAESAYLAIEEQYPLTLVALEVPLILTKQYMQRGLSDKAQTYLNDSIENYKSLLTEFAGTDSETKLKPFMEEARQLQTQFSDLLPQAV